jgi:hypothetical protein
MLAEQPGPRLARVPLIDDLETLDSLLLSMHLSDADDGQHEPGRV